MSDEEEILGFDERHKLTQERWVPAIMAPEDEKQDRIDLYEGQGWEVKVTKPFFPTHGHKLVQIWIRSKS